MRGFTVFLPVFNEQDILVRNTELLIQYLSALHVPYEILIGSNGSVDETPRIGSELQAAHPEVRFFHLPQKGPGLAFRRAVELMRHDHLICLDMDLPVSLDFIPQSADLLEAHDIVIGAKKLGVENRSFHRRFGSDLFILCSKRLLGLPFDDYSLGAKAYRKGVIQRYGKAIDQGTFYVQNIIFQAHRDGLRIVQLPVRCDDNRTSRFNLLHEGLYRFGHLFRLWISSVGRRVAQQPVQ